MYTQPEIFDSPILSERKRGYGEIHHNSNNTPQRRNNQHNPDQDSKARITRRDRTRFRLSQKQIAKIEEIERKLEGVAS